MTSAKPSNVVRGLVCPICGGDMHRREATGTRLVQTESAPPKARYRYARLRDVAFQRWVIQRKDEFVPWSAWWTRAKGDPRRLGPRRVSLPLFPDDEGSS